MRQRPGSPIVDSSAVSRVDAEGSTQIWGPTGAPTGDTDAWAVSGTTSALFHPEEDSSANAAPFVCASHHLLFADEATDVQCDVCAEPLQPLAAEFLDDPFPPGRGGLLVREQDGQVWEDKPLCPQCATMAGLALAQRHAQENEEN